jgi:hypothetical protein
MVTFCVKSKDILISFTVFSLFTRVPIMEALNLLSQHSDESYTRLLWKCDLYSGNALFKYGPGHQISCGFLQSLQANSITSFHILSNSLFTVIKLFITVKSELLTRLLNELKINKWLNMRLLSHVLMSSHFWFHDQFYKQPVWPWIHHWPSLIPSIFSENFEVRKFNMTVHMPPLLVL